MQQQTLVLYTRLKAASKMPAGFLAPSPGGTPTKAAWADPQEEKASTSASGALDAGAKALHTMSRGLAAGNHGSLGLRMIVTVWKGWARGQGVVTRRVATLKRRWLAGRTARWLRAWRAVAAVGELEAAAAAASVRRYQRRCQRRVFMTWRGIAAGLTSHELAFNLGAAGMFTPGSPAAGLAAIAALARGSEAEGVSRAAAVAAAMAAAGEDGTPAGTPGTRFVTPMATPSRLGGEGWEGGRGGQPDEVFVGRPPHVMGRSDDERTPAGRGLDSFRAAEEDVEGQKVKALMHWIDDILDHENEDRPHRENVDEEGHAASPTSPAPAARTGQSAGLATPARKGRDSNGDAGWYSVTAASTPTPKASPAPDAYGRRVNNHHEDGATPPGSDSRSSSRRASPLVSAFDAAAAAVSSDRIADSESGRRPADGVFVPSAEGDSDQEEMPRNTEGESPSFGGTPPSGRFRRAAAAALSLRRRESRSPESRSGAARDAILSLAFERAAVAEAAVQMVGGQRVRAMARRALLHWFSFAVRARAEKQMGRMAAEVAAAAAEAKVAAEATTAAAVSPSPKRSTSSRWFSAMKAVASPRRSSNSSRSAPSSPMHSSLSVGGGSPEASKLALPRRADDGSLGVQAEAHALSPSTADGSPLSRLSPGASASPALDVSPSSTVDTMEAVIEATESSDGVCHQSDASDADEATKGAPHPVTPIHSLPPSVTNPAAAAEEKVIATTETDVGELPKQEARKKSPPKERVDTGFIPSRSPTKEDKPAPTCGCVIS